VQRYTADLDYESFRTNEMIIDAVVRNFTVIGEAARHIPDEIEERWPEIPWFEMRGMRNVVVHEYFGVDHQILWQTAESNLPPLIPLLTKLLEEESDR